MTHLMVVTGSPLVATRNLAATGIGGGFAPGYWGRLWLSVIRQFGGDDVMCLKPLLMV